MKYHRSATILNGTKFAKLKEVTTRKKTFTRTKLTQKNTYQDQTQGQSSQLQRAHVLQGVGRRVPLKTTNQHPPQNGIQGLLKNERGIQPSIAKGTPDRGV